MRNALTPTKLKLWSTLAIFVSYWLASYIGDSVGAAIIETKHPAFMEAMRKAITPQLEESVTGMFPDAMQTGIYVGILKVLVIAVVSYLCACLVVSLASHKEQS